MYKMTKEELRRAKKLDLKTAQAGWTTLDVLEWLEKNMEIEDLLNSTRYLSQNSRFLSAGRIGKGKLLHKK